MPDTERGGAGAARQRDRLPGRSGWNRRSPPTRVAAGRSPSSRSVERPAIDSVIAIPTNIRFGRGEAAVIVIRNDDRISHRAGPWVVEPGQTLVQRFPGAGEYFVACSVDPTESVIVTVEG